MKIHLIDKNSDTLLVFFTGWGCDEFEFAHLNSNFDVLLLYDYSDLNFSFDFSKYKNFNLIAFSAGVFISSIVEFNIQFDKKIAISGNPYLFDENLGLSKEVQNVLSNITVENVNDFARNYLVKTDNEWRKFHHSRRTLNSCKHEFESLKNVYQAKKQDIKDIFNAAIIGSEDPIFNVSIQKKFFGERLKIIENARHSLFFRIKEYQELLKG